MSHMSYDYSHISQMIDKKKSEIVLSPWRYLLYWLQGSHPMWDPISIEISFYQEFYKEHPFLFLLHLRIEC